MSTIIKLDKVSKAFSRRVILKDVSLSVEAGRTVGIVGLQLEAVNLSFSRLFVVFLCLVVELFLCVIKRWATAETFLKTWGY